MRASLSAKWMVPPIIGTIQMSATCSRHGGGEYGAVLDGKWFCHFGKRKGKKRKKPFSGKYKEKEEQNSFGWEVKRERKYFHIFFGSEKKIFNVFPLFGK